MFDEGVCIYEKFMEAEIYVPTGRGDVRESGKGGAEGKSGGGGASREKKGKGGEGRGGSGRARRDHVEEGWGWWRGVRPPYYDIQS